MNQDKEHLIAVTALLDSIVYLINADPNQGEH